MRITKTTAEQVALTLAQPYYDKEALALLTFQQKATEIIKQNVPADVFEMQKKYPEFINVSAYFRLDGHGFSFDMVKLTEDIPQRSHRETYSLNGNDGAILQKLNRLHLKAKESRERFELDVVASLMQLRTYKNIEEQFPEAFALLSNTGTCTAIAINVSDVRNRIIK